MSVQRLAGSFRDPSGFVFRREGTLYRQINEPYARHYARLVGSGLYEDLAGRGWLVRHEEVSLDHRATDDAHAVIRPDPVWFVSYPYEWCFGQLKAAAALTLDIQRAALERDMSLRDASAYNVQFRGAEPVFIDTLSFECYEEGRPWVAYRQFCQHFLAPLALMSRKDVRLGHLLRVFLDGVPLDLASALLPLGTRLSPGLLMHLHLHAKSQKRYSGEPERAGSARVSKRSLAGIVESLASTVRSLRWSPEGTAWADYYSETNYADSAFEAKKKLVSRFLARCGDGMVWDLGANTGLFSRIATDLGRRTVSFDSDPGAVERNFAEAARSGARTLLPLVLDLSNPSPGIGWEEEERDSFLARGPAHTVLALALIHHLAIGNNVPLHRVARFLARAGEWLIVEFVPKSDSQVRRLLASRDDVFENYDVRGFEASFAAYFDPVETAAIPGTERTVYLMRRRAGGETGRPAEISRPTP